MHKTENVVHAARSGFTLIELLIVVAILGILGTIGIPMVSEHIANSKITAAQTSVNTMRDVISGPYMTTHSKYPTDLKVLIEEDKNGVVLLEGGEGALIDPFGNPYRIEVKGRRFAVISDGPDGAPNTEDDIRSDKIKVNKKD